MKQNIDSAVIERAKQNFQRRHARGDRAWDATDAAPDGSTLCLTEAERTEFLAQAQYEIARMKPGLSGWMIEPLPEPQWAHAIEHQHGGNRSG